jgi:hypothetical protein
MGAFSAPVFSFQKSAEKRETFVKNELVISSPVEGLAC